MAKEPASQPAFSFEELTLLNFSPYTFSTVTHSLYLTTLSLIDEFMEMLDNWTFERRSHSYRVARLALLIGENMGLSRREMFVLGAGSLLHDIGKMRIPREILLKPEKLTAEEWSLMRQHPRLGSEILERFPSLQFASPMVVQHQERWDGSGYPEGLKEKEIVPEARIFAVADSYDAMTNQRSYNVVKSAGDACHELSRQAGTLYDPNVIHHFLGLGDPVDFEHRIRWREQSFLQEIFPVRGFVELFAREEDE